MMPVINSGGAYINALVTTYIPLFQLHETFGLQGDIPAGDISTDNVAARYR
jgi:hypothetical protein